MNVQETFDPDSFKTAARDAWDRAAAGWNEKTPQIHAWLQEATHRMIDRAGVAPGMQVLDIAAGAGDQTLDVARRVGPTGSVLATDLSAVIVQLALDNARRAGLSNVQIRVADAEALGLEGAEFDAAVCRLGLMFCPDVRRALGEVLGALKPGGRFSALVFSQPQSNPCIGILMSTALQHAGLAPRDPFQPGGLLSLGKPGLLERLFGDAGFEEIAIETIPAVFRLPSTRDYLDFIRTSATPIRQMLSGLDDIAQAAAWSDIERKLDAFQTASGWQGPNELLLAVGRRPASA